MFEYTAPTFFVFKKRNGGIAGIEKPDGACSSVFIEDDFQDFVDIHLFLFKIPDLHK